MGSGLVADLAQRLNAVELRDLDNDGVMARIEYEEQGRTVAEELYSCRYLFAPIPGPVTQQNWGFTRTFSFRADPDRLDARRSSYLHIAASLFYNEQWTTLSQQIVQQLNGQFVQGIQAGYDKLRSEAQFQQQLSGFYQSHATTRTRPSRRVSTTRTR